MDIEYHDFNNNWFEIVFNNEMSGDALIYTTGKNASNRTQALYYYFIHGRSSIYIQHDGSKDWTEILTVINEAGGIRVIYQQ